MVQVNVRTLKSRLSAYLDRAGRGEAVVVLRRGRPIVRMVPAARVAREDGEVERRLQELVAEGTIQLPTKTGPWLRRKPLRIPGARPISEIIVDDRRNARY